MDFEHFILTRFNVKANTWSEDKFNNPTLTKSWLEQRFKLFEKYCLPSILNQSNPNFKWLIYFDDEIEEQYRKKIDSYCSKFKLIIPKYVNSMGQMYKNLHSDIIDSIHGKPRYLITTRLDNDDGLAINTISKIQNFFNCQKYEFVNFYKGLLYDPKRKLLLEKYQLNNPFISLIEQYNSNSFTTVWCGEHGKLSNLGEVININTNYHWIQIIHENNLSNHSDNKNLKPILKDNLHKIFGYPKENISLSLYLHLIKKSNYLRYRIQKRFIRIMKSFIEILYKK